MAKRKTKKKIVKREEEAKQIFKTVKGKRQKYVNVTIRKKGKKTINKQYKYRGGRFSTYIDEAKIPSGSLYYVNYRENRIIRNPSDVDALVKRVRQRRKDSRKLTGKKKKKRTKKEILEEFKIVKKKTYKAPMPIEATKVIESLDGKLYYEREHSITEFSTMSQNNEFLVNLLKKATKSRKEAVKLMHNFDKIKLKMSYAVVIEGINEDTKQIEQIGSFTAIGKQPIEIAEFLKGINMMPNDEYIDLYEDVMRPFKNQLDSHGVRFNKDGGRYRITDVRMAIKFYNNPQKRLDKYN